MKQKILYIILLFFTLAWSTDALAWGETTSYVLENSSGEELSTNQNGTKLTLYGPGAKISFEAAKNMGTAIGSLFVEKSTDGSNWSTLQEIGVGSLEGSWGNFSFKSFEYNIDDINVRYIRFRSTGSYKKKYRNVKVTRATTFSTSTTSLAFGNIHRITNKTKTLNASVAYNNTTYNQQVTGTNLPGCYSVEAKSVGATGTVSVPVTFTAASNTSLGAHNGNITLTMAGKTVTIAATANVVTTYYGKAIAAASAGGSAYVSFTSYDAATSTNATTNTANTTAANGSKAAYYKATVNTGYVFLGWIKGTGAYSANSVVSTSLTYCPTINYNSETSGSPTETTYKAWFAPMFYFSATATPSNGAFGTATASVTGSVQGNPDESTKTVTATFTAASEIDCTFNGWYEASDYSGMPVSMNETYTRNLTDNNVSSITPVSLTLYALFKTTQNLQWAVDATIVEGMEIENAATVTSGNTITYTSDDSDVIEIVDGKLKAKNLGTCNITATVEADFTFNGATISREFTVGEKLQATFTPEWGEGDATIELGSSTTIGLTNIATDGTFRISASPEGIISWSRSGNILTITGDAAGEGDADGKAVLTLVQDPSATVSGANTSFTINVSKYANDLAVVAETKAMKVGDVWTSVVTADTGNGNTIQATYDPEGSESIAAYDATNNKITALSEGSTSITLTQPATDTHRSATKTIAVNVTKVSNTLTVTLPSTTMETEVGNSITPTIDNKNNDYTDIVATITTQSISTIKDSDYGVISYENGVITARNAGTATIKFSQAATAKYTGYESETYTITVNKISNTITITNLGGGTATNIRLKYGATASLAYSATNTDTSPVVSRASGSYTTFANNTITAGNSPGTDIYEIRQAETYKYEAGYAQFVITVNNTDEAIGYVLDESTQYSHGTGSGVVHTYTLSGPGETIFYSARTQWGAIYYNLYVEYSTDNENWKEAQNNQSLSDSYKDFSCSIPEEARYIRFRFPAGGTLTKYIKDVKVSRKTYVRASSNITNLGTLYTDQTATATFTVNYSTTNGGNINISTNNDNFAPSTASLTVANNSDATKTFTVTYTPDPDNLGEESAVITIGDLFYTQQITLTATSRKYDTSIARGSNTATATTVEGSISDNVFAFSGTTTATPSASSEDDFYYSISSSPDEGMHNGANVISYNPATNTITGLEAGTARLTIYQKKTLKYHATSQSFDFIVTRLPNNVGIALSATELDVDGLTTVTMTNPVSDGALSVTYSNVTYTNESQNREGGLLTFAGNTLTGWNAGTGTVTITQAETYKYVAKIQSFDVTVNKLPQTLTWDNPSLETTMQVSSTLEGNTATSDVGLTPVTYSSGNTAAITVDANTGVLTAVATGSNVGITATQAGNYKYLSATLTRQFSVFNKQTPAFAADSNFEGTNGRVEYTGTATITVTGVGADSEQGFTITNGDNSIINVVRDGETITITGLQVGSTTLTLAQAGNDDFIAKSQTYNIEVYWPDDFLALSSTIEPTHTAGTYRKVFVNNTLKSGYSTIALPFNTTVGTLTGRAANDNDWVAQLSVVTYNAHDGYSLYFSKSNTIEANQPYILHLGTAVDSPVFTDVSVVAAEEATQNASKGIHVTDWTMHSNYDPAFDMNGYYGVVNGEGVLKKGTANSTLKAFHAYIEGPTSAEVKAAYLDEDEADGILELFNSQENQDGDQLIYDLQGRRLPRAQAGINIVIRDGKVRKEIEPRR